MGSASSKADDVAIKTRRLLDMQQAILDFAHKHAKIEPRCFVPLDVFHGAAMDYLIHVKGLPYSDQVFPDYTAHVLTKHIDGVFVAGIKRTSVLVGITLKLWPRMVSQKVPGAVGSAQH